MVLYLENIENKIQKQILIYLLLITLLLVIMSLIIIPYVITNILMNTNLFVALSIELIWVIILYKIMKFVEKKYNVVLL